MDNLINKEILITQIIDGTNYMKVGADPGFLERGFVFIKVWGLALLILSQFS